MTTRAVLGVWTLAMLVAAGATLLVAASDHENDKLPTILLAVPTALAFVASGIIARSQRPQNATGFLLILVGFAWAIGALTTSNNDYVFTAGIALGTVFTAMLAHLFLAFPRGRLTNRADRWIVGLFYTVVIVAPTLAFLFDEGELSTSGCDGPCPDNVLGLVPFQPLATAIAVVYAISALALTIAVLVRMVQRWRRASLALRRSLAPVFATAAVLITIVVVQSVLGFVSEELAEAVNWITLAAILAVPLAFLYGLLRPRFGAATRRLVAELSEKRHPAEVQAVLRRVLRDPELEIGYSEGDRYVDVDARPLVLPPEGEGRTATAVAGQVIVHDAALRDQPELDEVLDAVRMALERGVSLRSLETSERRAGALLDAIPDNVFRVRADGLFLDANVKRNVTVLGGAEAFIGKTIPEVMPPSTVDLLMETLERVIVTGEPAVVEYEIPFGDDPKQIEARLVRSGEDEVVTITRDVTERKRREHEIRALLDEQAALRRVATLAAEVGDRERDRLFGTVTEEAGRLLDAQTASTIRFAEDGSATVVGSWSAGDVELIGPGTVIPLDSETPIVHVARTGTPARIESYEGIEGELAARMRATGRRSGVAAPIFVSGRLWGAIHAGRTTEQPFPAGAEQRIGQFGEIVGIALANAEAREALADLVEEQAALSRVALAVATADRPENVFAVVTEEVGRQFRAHASNLIRFDDVSENEAVVVGGWSERDAVITPVGTRIELLGGAVTDVRRTGKPARASVPDVARSEPELLERLRALGIRSLVAVPIEVSGELWGAVVVWRTDDDEFEPDVEGHLVQFGKLVAVAVANAEAREQLTASRARVVQAGDAARRRLERNLHDGAQQRLVTLSLSLRLAMSKLHADPTAAQELLEAAASELALALEELRELARGLHPAILSDRGLGAALEALVARAPLPVELHEVPPDRLPPPVEAAAYYVVAETLTNVAKYAAAESAHVTVTRRDGLAIVEVEDDGVGGADVRRGSGLRGLADRVEALNGRLLLTSEPGQGTNVRAEIPCEAPTS